MKWIADHTTPKSTVDKGAIDPKPEAPKAKAPDSNDYNLKDPKTNDKTTGDPKVTAGLANPAELSVPRINSKASDPIDMPTVLPRLTFESFSLSSFGSLIDRHLSSTELNLGSDGPAEPPSSTEMSMDMPSSLIAHHGHKPPTGTRTSQHLADRRQGPKLTIDIPIPLDILKALPPRPEKVGKSKEQAPVSYNKFVSDKGKNKDTTPPSPTMTWSKYPRFHRRSSPHAPQAGPSRLRSVPRKRSPYPVIKRTSPSPGTDSDPPSIFHTSAGDAPGGEKVKGGHSDSTTTEPEVLRPYVQSPSDKLPTRPEEVLAREGYNYMEPERWSCWANANVNLKYGEVVPLPYRHTDTGGHNHETWYSKQSDARTPVSTASVRRKIKATLRDLTETCSVFGKVLPTEAAPTLAVSNVTATAQRADFSMAFPVPPPSAAYLSRTRENTTRRQQYIPVSAILSELQTTNSTSPLTPVTPVAQSARNTASLNTAGTTPYIEAGYLNVGGQYSDGPGPTVDGRGARPSAPINRDTLTDSSYVFNLASAPHSHIPSDLFYVQQE